MDRSFIMSLRSSIAVDDVGVEGNILSTSVWSTGPARQE